MYVDPLDHIGEELFKYGEYEPMVTDIIEARLSLGGTAIDIGAHYGNHTISMREAVGKDGRVLAIEPNPVVHTQLRRTIRARNYQNVNTICAAVSDRNTTGHLIVSDETQRDLSMVGTVGDSSTNVTRHEIELITLESIIDDLQISRIDFLKIDTEGHELSVLRGLGDSIGMVETLLLEVHEDHHSESQFEELMQRLDPFSCYSIVKPGYPARTEPVLTPDEIRSTSGRQLLCW